MRTEDTVRIAAELGVVHGRFRDTPQVLISDFFVSFDDWHLPEVVLQAKYTSDLKKPQTIERLMIEKCYWEEKTFRGRLLLNVKFPKQYL